MKSSLQHKAVIGALVKNNKGVKKGVDLVSIAKKLSKRKFEEKK